MSKYIYLQKINYFVASNIYKFGIIEKNEIQEFMKLFSTSYTIKNITKATNIIFHILCDITHDTEIKIKNTFIENFYFDTHDGEEYYKGDYKKMVDIIYFVINNKQNINLTIKNQDTIKLIKHDDIKNIETEKMNYIYLLQEREFVESNKNIFKIGMSKTNNYTRFKQYPNNSILLFQMKCENAVLIEKYIIKNFKNMFINKREIGNEYFEGDKTLMVDKIYNILINENQPIPEVIQNKITALHIKKISYEDLINEYINSEKSIRENSIFKCVRDEMKKLGIENEKKETLEPFISILKTKKEITNHINLIELLKTNEIFEFNNKHNNNYNKILVIRKIEKDNNIHEVDFDENIKVVMDDIFFEYITQLFCSVKKKPQTGRELKMLYITFLKHLCFDMVIRKNEEKKINNKRKKITKYFLNLEKIKLSLELNKFKNADETYELKKSLNI